MEKGSPLFVRSTRHDARRRGGTGNIFYTEHGCRTAAFEKSVHTPVKGRIAPVGRIVAISRIEENRKIKKMIVVLTILAGGLLTGTCVLFIRPAAPPLRVEVRPAPPHSGAIWVEGRWKYKHWGKSMCGYRGIGAVEEDGDIKCP